MKKILITVDIEAQPVRASGNHIERLCYGRFGDGQEFGIGKMFDIAEQTNTRLTCFLDYAEAYLYGDEFLNVGRYIKSRGHDLQLHLHPEFLTNTAFVGTGVTREDNMFLVNRSQAEFLIEFCVDTHEKLTGESPIAFRGGGYRYNGEILNALAKRGIRFNSSYNPARSNQPFNIGPTKQFDYTCGITELPISCVANYMNSKRLYEYNFNSDILKKGSTIDCIHSHEQYLNEYFLQYGDEAIAILVMHCWSFLNFNYATGTYDSADYEAADKFVKLLEMLNKKYTLVTASDLSSIPAIHIDHIVEYKFNKFAIEQNKLHDAIVCDVCGAENDFLEDYNGPKRKCKLCGSLERQRTFAKLLKLGKELPNLCGKKILHISPSVGEKKVLSQFADVQIVTLDIREEITPDIVADICNMPQLIDGSFDIIIASHVLVHVYNLCSALSELARVLKDDGIFISYEPSAPDALTEEIHDEEKITDHYGQGLYKKYKIGRFRNFGELDLDVKFRLFFERSKYIVQDDATGMSIVWNIWSKSNISEQIKNLSAKLALHDIHGKDSDMPSEILGAEYIVNNCPICGDSLAIVEKGQNCQGCGSRARLRSLVPLMSRYFSSRLAANLAIDLPLLAFAMTGAEKKLLSTVFRSFKSVSLFGNYGLVHESGVDMRDLSRYAQESFAGVFGCLLFDYFLEHEQALQECFRVIAPGGIFFTHIAPYRLIDGNAEPELKGMIKSRTGYFEYLPDKTELPDVKVGRDWFVAAMRRVGFEATIVKVTDAASGVISEWFIGVKPGRIWKCTKRPDAAVRVHPKSKTLQSRSTEVFRCAVPWGENALATLKFELLESTQGSLHFLEERCLPTSDGGGELRETVATNGSRDNLFVSRNLGNSWCSVYSGTQWDSRIRSAFSLADGGRLVRTFSGRMYHFDVREELVSCSDTGMWHWHGSQGIGQAASGTVMYAEYAPLRDADGVQELSVWRYRPQARTEDLLNEATAPSMKLLTTDTQEGWHKVLTLPAAACPPQGELRHFHVCRPHSAYLKRWILASGDVGKHCRLWLSDDDGNAWHEVLLDQVEKMNMPESCPNLLRFTQFSILENGDLIWGTDDTTNAERSALIRLSLTGDRPVLRFLGWLGENCVRNIMSCGNDRFLLLSESVYNTSSADCILYDAETNRITHLLLPNPSQARNSVADSLGSAHMVNGIGFFPARGAILMPSDKRGIFRVSIEVVKQ
ncbi:methyltransferase domain-containing protein [Desulfovibrio sp.]|uniref:methyltransferase domain-containing protein n=1 Tax=Desulfovibrio sp. TaxID=885 RepID=UPI0025B8DD98|nr:methyltransferase domain-containing protein [Desulfovibrio sp.]